MKVTNDTLTRILTKADVVNMLRGTTPYGEEMTRAIEMGIGTYHGGQNDHFEWCKTWCEKWEQYTTHELYDLYCNIEIDNQREDTDKRDSVLLAYWDTGCDPGVKGVFSIRERAEQYARKHSGLTIGEYVMNKED